MRGRGVTVSLTPSGTASVTEEKLRALRDAGLGRLAVSLDGTTAAAHDAFRGVHGSHRHTLRILERAPALGLPLQVNTTVCRQTVDDLSKLPSAALGGILVAAAYSLCDFGEFRRLWNFRGVSLAMAIVVLAGVVGIGVMEGILLARSRPRGTW